MKTPKIFLAWTVLSTALVLGACTPQIRDNGSFLNKAEATVKRALDSGAADFAPVELRQAREKLAQARGEYDAGSESAARWTAAEGAITGRLARFKTLAARKRQAVHQTRVELDRMRRELLHETP